MDPYERPPQEIRNGFKKYKVMQADALDEDEVLIDLVHAVRNRLQHAVKEISACEPNTVRTVFERFLRFDETNPQALDHDANLQFPMYEVNMVPGLVIVPSLLPPAVQRKLLSSLLHRHLSNPDHNTNIGLHHKLKHPLSTHSVSHPASFFSLPPSSETSYQPRDPTRHGPLQHRALLTRKLRWLTLGGQYDWTAKQYPSSVPPQMPTEIAELIQGLFPAMKPEAAIVNIYSPGDTLSVHRDVSESSSAGLVSLSLGCDGIFVVAGGTSGYSAIRLRSGDALFMTGAARFAWHGLSQIIAGTCPEWLTDWPAASSSEAGDKDGQYESWRGWVAEKRINLNVRQIWD